MPNEKIEDLWDWFVQNEQGLTESIDKEMVSQQVYFKDQLDNLILDFGLFSWEIGQGKDESWYLTISPNNSAELLKVSKEIMKHAPELRNWQFNYCKPPKKWDRRFSVYDSLMNLQKVNASEWRYRFRKDLKGERNIEIQMIGNILLDEEAARKAAETLVINEIGEELRIRLINQVEVIDLPDEKLKHPIEKLKTHILKKEE